MVELARFGERGRQVQNLLAEEEAFLVVEHGRRRPGYGYRPRKVVASATRFTATM